MAEKELKSDDTHLDFFKYRGWQMKVTGFIPSRRISYKAYRLVLFSVILIFQGLAFYGCALVPKKMLIVNTVHHSLVAWFAWFGLLARLITYRSLNTTREAIRTGLFHYEGEEVHEEEKMLRRKLTVEARKRMNIFLVIAISAFCSNMIYTPVAQLLFLPMEQYLNSGELLNPYLPHFFYTPFSTKNTIGYTIAFLLDSFYYFMLYAIVVSMNAIYTSGTVQLRVHLELLNYSLKNIHRRAVYKFTKRNENVCNNNNYFNKDESDDLFRSKAFQECLYSCLRSNVKHHQAVLRFAKFTQPYFGSVLLIDFTLAAAINATMLYLIFQQPPLHLMINYVGTFIAEQIYTFLICFYAEEILDQSKELFRTLYGMSWFHYDKKFNKVLSIMLSNTIQPLGLRTLLLGIPGCLETYGDILSGMYKLVSVVRQSDALN